jgi:aryl-alcohol dehydrogenase-like predicted oxidoreductase
MRLRSLGRTDLTVSEIGLGLAAVGRPGYINLGRGRDLGADRSVESLRRRTHALLDAALAGGVRYFDAARSYGLAEEFLASWLESRGFPTGDAVVGSKWGYRYTADWRVGADVNEIKDLSAANLRRQLAESRGLFGERLCLYQIHSATIESGVLDDREVLGELARMAELGTAIGLTVSGPRQADTIRRALEVRVDGRSPFGCVQATWNLFEQSAAPALAEAAAAGWGVIVKEALANGRLVQSGGSGRRPLDAVAIAAALAQPWSDVVLSGAVTAEQLAGNLTATSVRLTPDDLAGFSALTQEPQEYWAARAALPWT